MVRRQVSWVFGVCAIVGWPLACVCLLVAATMKAVDFETFVRYLHVVSGFPDQVCAGLAVGLIFCEVLLPVAALFGPVQRLAILSVAWLYAGFAAFHWVRLITDDPLPCSCFGSVAALSATNSLALDMVLSIVCFLVALSKMDKSRPTESVQSRGSSRVCSVLWLVTFAFYCGTIARVAYAQTGTSDGPPRLIENAVVANLVSPKLSVTSGSGNVNALIIFGDYQCPFCQKLAPVLASLASSRIPVYWRENPQTGIHDQAFELATLSKLAGSKSRLARVNAWLLTHAAEGRTAWQNSIPKLLGFSPSEDEMGAAEQQVASDRLMAKELGLRGTPALLVIDSHRKVYQVRSIKAALALLNKPAEKGK